MKKTKEQSMREEAREAIIKVLTDSYTGYYCDLHNEVFNTDYYIIGTYKAKEVLTEYGVFEAIEKVQEYEQEHFGETCTDLSNPELVVNMLFYIIGEEELYSMMENIDAFQDNWDEKADEELNELILKEIGGRE